MKNKYPRLMWVYKGFKVSKDKKSVKVILLRTKKEVLAEGLENAHRCQVYVLQP